MGFSYAGKCLDEVYITDSEIIDRFVGTELWVWGDNTAGQLGTASTTHRSSPVQTISGGTNWKQVSAGDSSTAAIKTDGTLWLWGDGKKGQLGNNAVIDQSSPVQTVSGGNNWKQVSVGVCSTAAIKTDGSLWLFGGGLYGILGNNNTIEQSSPVQTVSGGNNWKQVSVGICHAAAIKTDGTLWLWGRGDRGNLGDNANIERSSPVQTVSGGNNWKQVSVSCHTAAIKTDGTLWLWGDNSVGVLGNNVNSGIQSSPVQTVSSGTNWKQVSAAESHTAAIKTDGTLWLWGNNGTGQLGTASTTHRSSPVQTISGGTNWKQVSAGGSQGFATGFTAAIKTDGTLWLWGAGGYGVLGNNAVTNTASPVQTVSGGNNWKQVSLSNDGATVGRCPYTIALRYQE